MTSEMRNPPTTAEPGGRRGFLRALATLPLVGGGVTLIGNPTAAAEPVTGELLNSYDTWLFFERWHLKREREGLRRLSEAEISDVGRDRYPYVDRDGRPYDVVPMANGGARFHCDPRRACPSTRAAVVLAAVGCDWRRS